MGISRGTPFNLAWLVADENLLKVDWRAAWLSFTDTVIWKFPFLWGAVGVRE
jgi:hypothetical protein